MERLRTLVASMLIWGGLLLVAGLIVTGVNSYNREQEATKAHNATVVAMSQRPHTARIATIAVETDSERQQRLEVEQTRIDLSDREAEAALEEYRKSQYDQHEPDDGRYENCTPMNC